jgi:nitrous oxide reductase accessory protein NosL
MREHRLVDVTKQSYAMEYDRCSPSFLAFAGQAAAEDFAREHGGTVLRFEELAAALR